VSDKVPALWELSPVLCERAEVAEKTGTETSLWRRREFVPSAAEVRFGCSLPNVRL